MYSNDFELLIDKGESGEHMRDFEIRIHFLNGDIVFKSDPGLTFWVHYVHYKRLRLAVSIREDLNTAFYKAMYVVVQSQVA